MIDIIIVTYNAKDKLERCLKSIEKYTEGIPYTLIIVNNNSTDGTLQFLKNYKQKNIKIINNNKNFGFSGGANLGLKNTSNKFIGFLDDDTEVTKRWLTGLYKQIKNKRKVGIVGGKTIFPNNSISSAEYRVRPLGIVGHGEIDRGQRDYIKECDALIGTYWLMRRELIKKVGYFDERFFPSQAEDIDYCLRTRLAGYKIIYNGKVKIIHHHLFRDGKQFRKNVRKFLKKWRDSLHKFPLKNSHPVDRHIADGIDYLEKERFKQALTEFRKVELINKRFSEPVYMGITLGGMGKYNDAVKQFKKTLDLNPANFLAHYNLTLIYKKMGLVKEAKRESVEVLNFIHQKKKFLL